MLTRASLRYYAGTNALVILGVAVAVAVLGGALLVGASVRDSLRDIALGRLGATEAVLTTPTFFRDALGDALIARSPHQISAAPMIVAAGAVSHDESKRVAGRVTIYAVDDRFFAFHGRHPFPSLTGRQALVSDALAAELGATAGDAITLRLAKPTDIPLASIQGRREQTGERIRLTIDRVLTRETFGDFSLAPSQGPVLAIYVPLERLQSDLRLGSRVNTVLLGKGAGDHFNSLIPQQLKAAITLEDLGLSSRRGEAGLILESRAGLIADQLSAEIAEIAVRDHRGIQPVLTYVANAIKIRDREIPYSTVSGIDLPASATVKKDPRPLLWLNEWAAEDLNAAIGDAVTLDYYLWSDENGLTTASAQFVLTGVLPMSGPGGDATLTPDYPGISDAEDIRSWDPPFPVDITRVRKKDEDYWDRYRAAPKAIITLADAQRLWGSRYGKVSSLRLSGDAIDATSIDPAAAGLTIRPVREEALAAARGTTDFGEYFLYFSFFLVVSALLLAYLFFAVGLEQRRSEVGVLASIGFSASAIRRLFIREGAILAGIGAAIGIVGAIGYSALILYGLRTWWIGAVGTTDLRLHVAPEWLAAGAAGAFVAGLAALWLGVRAMSRRSARALLHGDAIAPTAHASLITRIAATSLLVIGAALLAAAMSKSIGATTGFFGAGGAWLVAGLCLSSILLRPRRSSSALRRGNAAMFALGVRHASVRPARSVLSLALIALASFVLVSIGAFKKDIATVVNDRSSGTGGFALMAESVAPLMHDPNTRSGRTELSLDQDDAVLSSAAITRFRLRPGDEASCLSLYRPTNPRIIAPESRFFDQPRFSFASSLANTAEERANPWLLLKRTFDDGAIAAVADQTTLTYSLHLGVGDDFTFTPDGHSPVRLRIVGALADSFLQSELILAEPAFVQLFPRHEGYRVWMIDAADNQRAAITTHLEDRLSDFGVDVIDTRARWASYHQVENTYLATFQALGSLGLLLGTVGLGAVLARNVLERRREIGLLRAVGFSPANIRNMVLSEGMALVIGGVILGAGCALIAIIPALTDRAQSLPLASLALVMLGVIATGLVASLIAIMLTTATPVVAAIKSE